MPKAYPKSEPYETGFLAVGDGHRIYWELCGNPAGKPVIVLHGGPGSGCSDALRRFFDPMHYKIVLFDQRGSGRSLPHAADADSDLSTNTTHHLISDIEFLRSHFGVDRWMVFGLSWGSTLALAYAERHPQRVTEIVLLAVTTTSPSEIEWLYEGTRRFFPEAWERLQHAIDVEPPDRDIISAYARALQSPDSTTRERAAFEWCLWEDAIVATQSSSAPNPRYDDPRFRLGFARVVTHYFSNRAWLQPDELLMNASALNGIRGTMVHGRFDMSAPLVTAWELAKKWPDGELLIVNAGHLGSDPAMQDTVVAATDHYR